jgi:hypothetical protein
MTKRRTRSRGINTRWVIGIVIAAVCVAGILVALSLRSTSSPPAALSSALSQCGKPTCGQANAPVTIEIYSDFQ